MKNQLRLPCFYVAECNNRVLVDFYAMRKHGEAHKELMRHKWTFGVARDGEGGVIFDPLCEACGRGVIKQMLDSGAEIDPEAEKSMRKLYPDLFIAKPESN